MTAPAKKAESSSDERPAKKGDKTYKVSAPLIAVTVGEQVLQYREGDILPGGIKQDSLDQLSELGFVAEND